MANRAAGGFGPSLGGVYGLFTAGFLGVVVILALLEQVGTPDMIIGYAMIGIVLVLFAVFGFASRTMQISDYYVSGHRVPAFYNGMATAGDWISGTVFLGLAGTAYAMGYGSLAFIVGWTAGFVVIAAVIAPRIRASDAVTLPDFLGRRYDSNLVRMLAVLVLIACSFVFLVAELGIFAAVTSRLLHVSPRAALATGLVILLFPTLLGGMRGLSWTQAAQYIVLVIAFFLPAALVAIRLYDMSIPQFAFLEGLRDLGGLQDKLVAEGLATASDFKASLAPYARFDGFNLAALVFCLMLGTASMPHLLMRFLTTPSPRTARRSAVWSLLFVALFYATVPAYVIFAKLGIYGTVVGAHLDKLPGWIFAFGKAGFVKICGADAVSVEAVRQACGAVTASSGVLRLSDFSIDAKELVTALPAIVDLPFIVVALIAAGALSAALATAGGAALSIGNSIGHDVYRSTLDRGAPAGMRIFVARVTLVATVGLAAYAAATRVDNILPLLAWTFSLTASGLFPALALGIGWKKTTWTGAISGMVAGAGITMYYLVASTYGFDLVRGSGDEIRWGFFGLTDAVASINAGVFGIPAGFLVTALVSLVTQPRATNSPDAGQHHEPRTAPGAAGA